MEKLVSIVICTYNRGHFLKRTLHSLRNLNYTNFEVVVVNGPSTDNTKKVLEDYIGGIKVINNPQANLSISRNMGIAHSSGEIVAFIDDDAIPDKEWLNDIVSGYVDEQVGGVGGYVYGPGNNHFQFEKGYVDFWGNSDSHYFGGEFNEPKGMKYNMMLGTNCTFRKKVLLEVGGFDEYFDYFHDESDLCLRVVRAGYKIKNIEGAYIHHEYAKSHIRKDTYDSCRLNWYPIIKNKIYFALKNSEGFADNILRDKKIKEIKNTHLSEFKQWKNSGLITKEEYNDYVDICDRAFERGKTDGYKKIRLFNFDLNFQDDFILFDKHLTDNILSICLLCKDNPRLELGGIAKYTNELAKGFIEAGHIVHIITAGNEQEEWISDWMDEGICYHKVSKDGLEDFSELKNYSTTQMNFEYSYRVYKTIERVKKVYPIDIIESALWDFEGSVAAHLYKNKLPVVVRIETPLLKVAETQRWKLNNDLILYSDFERELILDAAGVIAISEHIKETISLLYNVNFAYKKIFLGISPNDTKPTKNDEKFVILTVGRLERRKGIHTIFEILPQILEEYSSVEFRFIGNNEIVDEVLKSSYKDYFYRIYGREKWSKQVVFLGEVSNNVKDQEYANCDIVLAPSLYESFGLMLLEAMSSEKPVIGCKIGGMQEIIIDGETGYTIEVENSKMLYQKIKLLMQDKELRVKMGKMGKKRYKELFSNDIMVKNTLLFYYKLIRNGSI